MIRKVLMLAVLASASAWASDLEWVPATIVKMEPSRGLVTLAHGPIKSIVMDAMTMKFKVDPGMLITRKVGERVRFVIEKRDMELVVTRLEPDS